MSKSIYGKTSVNLTIDNLSFLSITTNDIVTTNETVTGIIDMATANASTLNASTANIQNINISQLSVDNLDVIQANASQINASNASIDNCSVDILSFNEIDGDVINIGTINSSTSNSSIINSSTGNIKFINASDVTADTGEITEITTNIIQNNDFPKYEIINSSNNITTINGTTVNASSINVSSINLPNTINVSTINASNGFYIILNASDMNADFSTIDELTVTSNCSLNGFATYDDLRGVYFVASECNASTINASDINSSNASFDVVEVNTSILTPNITASGSNFTLYRNDKLRQEILFLSTNFYDNDGVTKRFGWDSGFGNYINGNCSLTGDLNVINASINTSTANISNLNVSNFNPSSITTNTLNASNVNASTSTQLISNSNFNNCSDLNASDVNISGGTSGLSFFNNARDTSTEWGNLNTGGFTAFYKSMDLRGLGTDRHYYIGIGTDETNNDNVLGIGVDAGGDPDPNIKLTIDSNGHTRINNSLTAFGDVNIGDVDETAVIGSLGQMLYLDRHYNETGANKISLYGTNRQYGFGVDSSTLKYHTGGTNHKWYYSTNSPDTSNGTLGMELISNTLNVSNLNTSSIICKNLPLNYFQTITISGCKTGGLNGQLLLGAGRVYRGYDLVSNNKEEYDLGGYYAIDLNWSSGTAPYTNGSTYNYYTISSTDYAGYWRITANMLIYHNMGPRLGFMVGISDLDNDVNTGTSKLKVPIQFLDVGTTNTSGFEVTDYLNGQCPYNCVYLRDENDNEGRFSSVRAERIINITNTSNKIMIRTFLTNDNTTSWTYANQPSATDSQFYRLEVKFEYLGS